MGAEPSFRPLTLPLAFAFFLLFPSLDTALKYGGPVGVLIYFLVGTAIVFLAHRYLLPVFEWNISPRTADILAAATFIGLAAIALSLYPIANIRGAGLGTDADDALITAVTELLNGRYPYHLSTYLGNPISPMPGAVLLAIPFVVLGVIQLQNVFWLAVFYLVYRGFEQSSRSSLGLLWMMLALSPTVMQNIVTGADYTANSIYIVDAMWLLVRMLAEPSAAAWKRVLPAILLGVGLSSRSTFILLMPLLISILVQTAGWKNAIKYLTITGVVFIGVTLPFWLYDPAGFAPLRVQSDKLTAVEDVLPFASVIIPGSAVLLSLFLSRQKMTTDCRRFFRNCAIVQLYVLLLTSLIYSLKQGRLDLYLGQSGYGMFTLFFGATVFWMYLYNGSSAEFQNRNTRSTVG